jgi:hypothetical protein
MQTPDNPGAFFLLFIYEDLAADFVRAAVNLEVIFQKLNLKPLIDFRFL